MTVTVLSGAMRTKAFGTGGRGVGGAWRAAAPTPASAEAERRGRPPATAAPTQEAAAARAADAGAVPA